MTPLERKFRGGGGGGSNRKNHLLGAGGGGMDIFWNHTLCHTCETGLKRPDTYLSTESKQVVSSNPPAT